MTAYDILKHARIQVLGVTSPQVYLKVKGNWTGGHQENMRVRAANLNHGPASSIWHSVGGPEQIERFRKLVKTRYKIDLFKHEGLWFCDPDFCIANKLELITMN